MAENDKQAVADIVRTVVRKEERDYKPYPNRIDGFRLLSDVSREKHGLNPKWLNFDFRSLPPGECNAAYHFHRYAEELFLVLKGEVILRTPGGTCVIRAGDAAFFEAGEKGAHQLYNHSDAPCEYLDLRSSIGHDIVEYPDSDKLIVVPGGETFRRSAQVPYFDGEDKIHELWHGFRKQEG